MSQALHTSATGINAGQSQVNVVANNVANINTTAYKTANMTFETLYSQNLSYGSAATKDGGGTNPKQIGYGVNIGGITRNFNNGTFVATGRSMDLMISGTGFFVVKDAAGKEFFTRDGVFSTDSEGNVVTQSGMKVVGATSPYAKSSSSATVKVPTNMKAKVISTPSAEISTKALYELNDARITSGSFKVAAYNGDTKVGEAVLTIDSTEDTLGTIVAGFNTSLKGTFGVDTPISASVVDGGVKFNNGAYTLKFEAIDTNFLAQTGISSKNLESKPLNKNVTLQDISSYDDPDGLSLSGTTVDENGIIAATYSDGSILTSIIDNNGAARWKYITPEGVQITADDVEAKGSISSDSNFILELATMVNQEGLISLNNNLWKWGPDVGEIYYGMAGEMSFGTIESGGYEGSNVDIANELTNLISAQRMIQMNSRVFSTASSVMETLSYLGS